MICGVKVEKWEEERNRGGRTGKPCKWKVMLQKNEYWISVEVARDGTVVVAEMGVVNACFSSLARRSTTGTDPANEYIRTHFAASPQTSFHYQILPQPHFYVIASTLHTYRILAGFLFFWSWEATFPDRNWSSL